MPRLLKVGGAILLGLSLAIGGFLGGVRGAGLPFIRSAFADVDAGAATGSSISLSKPSCTGLSVAVGGAGSGAAEGGFVCVADLDGNGKQQVIVGTYYSMAWRVHIIDGTTIERGAGTVTTQ